MKYASRLESSDPLSQVIEIPDSALNDKLVPMNDNSKLTILSRENLEAASILAQRNYIEPCDRIGSGFIIAVALCLVAVAALVALLLR
jgi:hypothetical protein